jgi:hypothetical protein
MTAGHAGHALCAPATRWARTSDSCPVVLEAHLADTILRPTHGATERDTTFIHEIKWSSFNLARLPGQQTHPLADCRLLHALAGRTSEARASDNPRPRPSETMVTPFRLQQLRTASAHLCHRS